MAHSRRRIVVGLHVQRLHKSHKSLTGEFSWLLPCCYCLKQNSKKHFLFRRGSDKLVIYLQAASIYIWLCILFEIRLFAICDVALPIKWSALCLVASALIQKCCWCCNQFDGIFNLIAYFNSFGNCATGFGTFWLGWENCNFLHGPERWHILGEHEPLWITSLIQRK